MNKAYQLSNNWDSIREKMEVSSSRTQKMIAELPQRAPPTTLKSTTDGIYPLRFESVKTDKPAE